MDVYEGTALFATTQPPVSGDCDLAAARAERIVRAANNHDDLVKELQNIVVRFERALVAGGTTEEFAKAATENARASIARATKE